MKRGMGWRGNYLQFLRFFMLFVSLSLGVSLQASATHLRAGEITLERIGNRVYRITITVYTNVCGTNVQFGNSDDDFLDFGDGTAPIDVPLTAATPRLDLDPGGCVYSASFTTVHTYSGNGLYIISYRERFRNLDVLNMRQSGSTNFYVETKIIIDGFFGINNSPRLLIPPVDKACTGVIWQHNPGAYDPDGDSLSYELNIPFKETGTQVDEYKSPNDRKFYLNYETGNSDASGRPTFTIDPVTGTLTWDAPGASGEYNIAFHIIEWRKISGIWYQMGYVRRDMQIIVTDCNNDRPDVEVPNDTCVVAGTTINAKFLGIDPDNDSIKIEAFSEIFNFPPALSPATLNPRPGPEDWRFPPAESLFTWKTLCAHVKDQPYQVVIKVTDRANPRLVTYKSWFIRVIGPPPEWQSATLDLTQRTATVTWDPYDCNNATTMQVWRKVDGVPFVPDDCQTGIPEYLGYELVGTVPLGGGINSFLDSNRGLGLAPGAKYCYRLVALFPLPLGGESVVSADICVGPIIADDPVITHVTVERTATVDGEVRISWRKPFEADKGMFPEPYTYEVWRSNGFARGADSTRIASGISDTTFLDTNINSEQNVYAYSITARAANNGLVGNSQVASMVRLDSRSEAEEISLSWSAFVPWTNFLPGFPSRHLIYRGPENATDDELVLVDSVDVFTSGFNYVDTSLPDLTATYCYKVVTRGGYGNPAIQQPLLNFSQKICAQVGDDEPPCQPEPPRRSTLDFVDCDDYIQRFCGSDTYRNILVWNRAESAECRLDIKAYNIYASARDGEPFELIAANVIDTFYIDNNLPSFARCYKISAIDKSGNESELSDQLCIDNCPFFELPNVFTPNGDTKNETLNAYGDFNCAEGDCDVPIEVQLKCARFVNVVKFKVYNRWGQLVYTYTGQRGNDAESIYIRWRGVDSQGVELATGVYYYSAEVTFDTVDPAKQNRLYKGWVHLIR